ncbi:MAG: formate dehydrogenase [Rubrivivax sp.]|nr:formate dehydrogenase [Rubrivivax sp.]
MSKPSSPALNRRTVFAGAGAVGALAAAASVLPGQPAATPASTTAAKPAQGGGYRLSEHVKQYYASART